jgi:hypothetical protein
MANMAVADATVPYLNLDDLDVESLQLTGTSESQGLESLNTGHGMVEVGGSSFCCSSCTSCCCC